MNIIPTRAFQKNFKQLLKKYHKLSDDYITLLESLKNNPTQGVQIRGNIFKVRMKITAKGKGKSGGARVITLVKIEEDELYLITIYDKSERENISDNELDDLISSIEIL